MNAIESTAKPKRHYRTKAIKINEEIIAFESGESFTGVRIVNLFSRLVTTGLAWRLQGRYGRQAKWMIESGYIAPNGVVLKYPEED